MPRRGNVPKREDLPDPIYGDVVVTKLVNQIMYDGKKGIAEGIVYGAFEIVKQKTGLNPHEVFIKALENAKPQVEVKARRVGGATYQVPCDIREERKQTLAIRWMVTFMRKRSERTSDAKLAGEIMDAYNSTGATIKRRDEMHRQADANKAFAHYRY